MILGQGRKAMYKLVRFVRYEEGNLKIPWRPTFFHHFVGESRASKKWHLARDSLPQSPINRVLFFFFLKMEVKMSEIYAFFKKVGARGADQMADRPGFAHFLIGGPNGPVNALGSHAETAYEWENVQNFHFFVYLVHL